MGEARGGTALSLFRFHLSPFPPETPDTQANSLHNRQDLNCKMSSVSLPHPPTGGKAIESDRLAAQIFSLLLSFVCLLLFFSRKL